jgi:ferredoxin
MISSRRGSPPGYPGRPDPVPISAATPISRRTLFHLGRTAGPPAADPVLPPGAVDRTPGRIESPAPPLGEISVAAERCSACACCALACPTGALAAKYSAEPTLMLAFDAAACFACGACVTACPEGAVSLERVADRASLPAGRRQVAQVAVGNRCRSCGRPLAGGLVAHVVGQRLAASHPEIAARLRQADRCTDCLLYGPPARNHGR